MTKYIGPKADGENVATQSDVGGSALSNATPDALTPDQAGAAGTANAAARADHAHEIACEAAGAILPDDVAAEGTANTFARSDHTHSISAAAPGTIQPDAAAAEGSSTSFSRADHTHAINAAAPSSNLTASTSNSEGSSTSFSRADHSHALTTAAPSANLTATTTNASGSSASLSRADHSHAITTGSAGSITGSNAAGTSANLARADHDHAYGTGSIATAALADGAVTAAKLNADTFGKAQTIDNKTAAYTLVGGDAGKVITVNSASAVNVTINSSLGLSAGQKIDVIQTGAGQLTFVASSTTVNGTPGLKTRAQYSAATVLCTGSNTYIVIGDLAA